MKNGKSVKLYSSRQIQGYHPSRAVTCPWRRQRAAELKMLGQARAEEQVHLAAVLADRRRQEEEKAQHTPAQRQRGRERLQAEVSPVESTRISSRAVPSADVVDMQRGILSPGDVSADVNADVSPQRQPVNTAAMEFTDIPESLAGSGAPIPLTADTESMSRPAESMTLCQEQVTYMTVDKGSETDAMANPAAASVTVHEKSVTLRAASAEGASAPAASGTVHEEQLPAGSKDPGPDGAAMLGLAASASVHASCQESTMLMAASSAETVGEPATSTALLEESTMVMTTGASGAPDPHSIFASDTLTDIQLADPQAVWEGSGWIRSYPPGGQPGMTGGEGILTMEAPEEPGATPEWQRLAPPPRQSAGRAGPESRPSGGQAGSATPEADAPAAAAGATTTPAASARPRMFPAHIAAEHSGVPEGQPLVSPDVKREELLARRSAEMMSQVAQQVLTSQVDPEQMSGQELSATIGQLLGATQGIDPQVAGAQGGVMSAQGQQESSGSVDRSPQPYASLTELRRYLAQHTQQNTEAGFDAESVGAWLRVNRSVLELDAIFQDFLPQPEAAEGAGVVEGSQIKEELQESKPVEEAVAATLVDAMSHAQQCLMLITATQERPDMKALEALRIARQLRASLAAMEGAEISAYVSAYLSADKLLEGAQPVKQGSTVGRPSYNPLAGRIITGMSKVGAPLMLGFVLVAAWKLLDEYLRISHWPPPS